MSRLTTPNRGTPQPKAQGVIEVFSTGAGQLMSVLRLPLITLIALIGVDVPRGHPHHAVFFAIWIPYAAWSLAVMWWMFNRPVPRWSSWVTTFVDLAAFVALAAASSGATSYIGPVFYLYPVAVALHYRPRLTATVGFLIAGAYVVTWLPHLGKAGGPKIPLVVWLYSGLLLWLTAASTALTTFLVRRSQYVLRLLDVQQLLTAETLAVAEQERARIAEDLHDGPLQNLIAVRRNLEDLAEKHPGSTLLTQSDALLRDTTQALRHTVSSLHPQVLAQLGLTPALEELVLQYREQGKLHIHSDLADIGHVPAQDLLHGTTRELFTNINKHANATNVWLTLVVSEQELALEVTDDGIGFDASTLGDRVSTGHIGLVSRSVRIADLGGSITITPVTPHGTRVSVRLPTATTPCAPRPAS